MPDFSFGGWPEAFMDDWQSTRYACQPESFYSCCYSLLLLTAGGLIEDLAVKAVLAWNTLTICTMSLLKNAA